MTDKHQLKADSESPNSSDNQGATVVDNLEGSLAKLTLDKTTSSGYKSSIISKASSDSGVATPRKPCNESAASDSISKGALSVQPQEPIESNKEPKAKKDTESAAPITSTPAPVTTAEEGDQLSPKDLALKKLGLKATHRPGFYLYEDNPQRMRIQTSTHAFDLDRRCPHAKADMLKWGVLRQNNTLVCGVHYWRFNLEDDGKCIAHPEETLNACPVERCIDW
ncbi:hypothetical protein BGZ73_002335 [Actinomortierella ambigua]|nr:hypothetical protein BGZ73_002335 [Actinomortierella ambigua]